MKEQSKHKNTTATSDSFNEFEYQFSSIFFWINVKFLLVCFLKVVECVKSSVNLTPFGGWGQYGMAIPIFKYFIQLPVLDQFPG